MFTTINVYMKYVYTKHLIIVQLKYFCFVYYLRSKNLSVTDQNLVKGLVILDPPLKVSILTPLSK